MTLAALGMLIAASCNKKPDDPKPQKPVVTDEMYSVTVNAETSEVTFKFTADGLSPFWTVVDPANTKTTFTDREVTKTFKARGAYKGSLIAYGDGGQSDPVEFSFTIGATVPVDPTLSATENVLISTTWRIRYYGWYGGEGEEFWDYHEKAPTQAADDRLTFKKGGAFELNLGENKSVYNDDEGFVDNITVTGNEKWAYVKEGELEYVQFSDGGFPGMLGGTAAVNGKYLISDLTADGFSLCYKQNEEQWFYVTLVYEDFEEPAEGVVTEESAIAALSGKSFRVSDYGWWGDGWQYFAVADGGEELPLNVVNDYITFNADGSLTIILGVDAPLEEGGESVARIYNDGVANGEPYTVTGNPKWEIITDEDVVKVKFSDGGFPLMLAGKDKVEASDPLYHYGLNDKWVVASVGEDGTVRLEIYQYWTEDQWLSVFLFPVSI